ncbi:glycosyltransferase [Xanthomonas euvesicatoria]|uniref:glycosyltransferase n=1 Tax=Xanthomonas euvesicatoria TaxID=456327 RepID=UPI001C469FB4|nr:glycosyltransferase [Xanthomonas euvesicatoria]MBV6896577.1 glycosyltransferase [Xanthomonas campestris pv. ionidii]
MIANTIIIIIFLYFFIGGVINAIQSSKWKRSELENFHGQTEPENSNSNLYFYIIIPALREQAVISRTLERMSQLRYSKNRFEVVVALDSAELPPATAQAVNEFIKSSSVSVKITTTTYYGPKKRRSSQLNKAIDEIFKSKSALEHETSTFVAVYDADSFPNLDTLSYVNYFVEKEIMRGNEVMALQQTISYLKNFDRLSVLLAANALYQTLWNYIFEVPRFLHTAKEISQNKKVSFPPYCMGHGQFIRLDVLKKIGGLPQDGACDGIQLGFRLTSNRIKINPIPLDDECESPEDYLTLLRQQSFWYCGNLEFFKNREKNSIASVRPYFHHAILNIKWILRPWWAIAVSITAIDLFDYGIGALILMSCFFYYVAIYVIIKRNRLAVFHLDSMRAAMVIFLLPIAVLIKSIGGMYGVLKFLTRSKTFPKVERKY